jgi:osmoprotectant transport system permease protein
MKGDRAVALGVSDIADLTPRAPELILGGDIEFLSRPEWAKVRDAYDLRFRATKSFNPTFMYRALSDGEVDVISAFSSDGRIAAERLRVLTDSRHVIPPYDAVVLIAPGRARDARLRAALKPLIGSISVERMRQANLMVDRVSDKLSPQAAGRILARGLPP